MNFGPITVFTECIYCKETTNLTNEHIIPYCLLPNGAASSVLKGASCTACSGITSKFEESVISEIRGYAEYFKFRSRTNPKQKHNTIYVSKQSKSTIKIPSNECPGLNGFPLYGDLTYPKRTLPKVLKVLLISIPELSPKTRITPSNPHDTLEATRDMDFTSFTFLLGKIALCIASTFVSKNAWVDYPLPNLILTRDPFHGTYIGSPPIKMPRKQQAFDFKVEALPNGELYVYIWLYPSIRTTIPYKILAGTLSSTGLKEYANSLLTCQWQRTVDQKLPHELLKRSVEQLYPTANKQELKTILKYYYDKVSLAQRHAEISTPSFSVTNHLSNHLIPVITNLFPTLKPTL